MADLNTKQKILNAAIQLFNENGVANVRLQQIADEIGISVGNLAYHYKNKEVIVGAVRDYLDDEIADILSAYGLFPNLLDLDHQLSKYYAFAQRFPFYFFDLLEIERVNQEVHLQRQGHIHKMISQIRKRLDFNERRGLLIEEPRPGIYDSLAVSVWVIITFWHSQNIARGRDETVDSQERFKEMVWNLIYPFFTQAGKAEFEQLIVPMIHHRSI